MMNAEKTLDQISRGLIEYLKNELDNTMIGYDMPLTQMQGGYETYTYRFKLSGVQGELAKPLILRLYPGSMAPTMPSGRAPSRICSRTRGTR
jgi:hypothetical protein